MRAGEMIVKQEARFTILFLFGLLALPEISGCGEICCVDANVIDVHLLQHTCVAQILF